LESSAGEQPVATSASSDRESFLSRPASLPKEDAVGVEVRLREGRAKKKKRASMSLSLDSLSLSLSLLFPLTGVRLQLSSDVAVPDIDRVEEGAYPVRGSWLLLWF